jgi:hypothetical protein
LTIRPLISLADPLDTVRNRALGMRDSEWLQRE